MHTGKSHKKRQVYCDPIDDTLPSRLQLVAERTSPRRPVRNALKPLSINVDRPMMERLRDHKGQLRNAFASPSARRAVAHHGFVTPRKSETRGVKRKRSAKTTTSAQTQEAMLSPRKTRTQSRLAARRKAYDSEDSDVEQDGMEVEDAAQDTDDGFEDVTSSSSAPEPGSDVHEEEDDDAFYLEHAAQSQLMKLRKTRLIDLCTSAGLFDDDAELETLTKAILVDSILHWRTHRDSPDETSSEEASGSESSVQSPQMNRVRVGRTLRTRRGPSPTRPKVPDHRRLPYQTRSSLPSLCALTDAQLEISSQTTFGRSPTKPRRLRHVPSRARLRRQHTALPREYRNALDRRVRPESTAQYESTDDEWEAASAADDDSDADDQEDMPSPPKRQRSSTRVAFQGRSSEPQSRLVSRTHARRSQASDSAEDRESGRSSRSSKLAKGTTPVARRTRQATGGSITAIDFALADSHPVESDSEDEASHHSSHRSLRSSLRVSRSESVASQSSMRRRTRSGQHEVIVDEEEAVDPFSHPIMTDDEGSDRQDSDPDTDEEISITQTVGDDEDANEDVTITEDDAASYAVDESIVDPLSHPIMTDDEQAADSDEAEEEEVDEDGSDAGEELDINLASFKELHRLHKHILVALCAQRDIQTEGTKRELVNALIQWRKVSRDSVISVSSKASSQIERQRRTRMDTKAETKTQALSAAKHSIVSPASKGMQEPILDHASDIAAQPSAIKTPNPSASDAEEGDALDLESLDLLDKEIPHDKLHKLEKIGSGGFKDVYAGRYRNVKVAIGDLRGHLTENDIKELGLLRDLRHPNVVRFIGISIPPTRDIPCMIVTELCQNGDLFDYIRNVPAPPLTKMIGIMLDIAKGIQYLHNRTPSIIHRDIKSSNVLITHRGVAKLTDFGLARVKNTTRSMIKSLVGTVNWQAPELWVAHPRYNQTVDVYSAALVYWEILTWHLPSKKYPFEGMNEHAIYQAAGSQNLRPSTATMRRQWGGDIVDLVDTMWDANPAKRPTITGVIHSLQALLALERAR